MLFVDAEKMLRNQVMVHYTSFLVWPREKLMELQGKIMKILLSNLLPEQDEKVRPILLCKLMIVTQIIETRRPDETLRERGLFLMSS